MHTMSCPHTNHTQTQQQVIFKKNNIQKNLPQDVIQLCTLIITIN